MSDETMTLKASIAGESGTTSLSGGELASVQFVTDPQEIEVGITCGMSDMCGQDPCLCGATDSYGACACNGKETISSSVTVLSSDSSVAYVVEAGNSYKLVGLGKGEADITIHATLKHHKDVTQVVHVNVGSVSPLYLGAWIVALIACVAALVGIVRLLHKGVQKLRHAFKQKSKKHTSAQFLRLEDDSKLNDNVLDSPEDEAGTSKEPEEVNKESEAATTTESIDHE